VLTEHAAENNTTVASGGSNYKKALQGRHDATPVQCEWLFRWAANKNDDLFFQRMWKAYSDLL